MDRGAWRATGHAVAESPVQFSSWTQQHNLDLYIKLLMKQFQLIIQGFNGPRWHSDFNKFKVYCIWIKMRIVHANQYRKTMRQMTNEWAPLKILVLKKQQLTLPSYQVLVPMSIHRLPLSLNSNYLLKEWQQILQTSWGVVGFPRGVVVKNPPANAGDRRSDPWVGKWHPTPVFLLENPMDRGHLEGYSPCGRKGSDTTEHTCMGMCLCSRLSRSFPASSLYVYGNNLFTGFLE